MVSIAMLLGEVACAKKATQAATVTAASDTPTSTVGYVSR
jgi:hypothetical protein